MVEGKFAGRMQTVSGTKREREKERVRVSVWVCVSAYLRMCVSVCVHVG